VADHFQYLASSGLIALAVAVGHAPLNPPRLWRGRCAIVVSMLVLATLGTLTWRRQEAFQGQEALWRDTLRKNPGAWLAHNNLGTVLQDEGRLGQALDHYRQAVQLKGDYALALNNVGNVLRLQGRLSEAVDCYRRALQIRPDLVETRNRLGATLQAQGKLGEAVSAYVQATQVRPKSALSYYNLAGALRLQGKTDLAIRRYREAVRLKPDFAEAHYGLGLALILDGQPAAALAPLREALQLRPDWVQPMVSAARILATHADAEVRQPEEAIRLAERACELTRHKDAWALDTLAAAYASAGDFERAVATAGEALAEALVRGTGDLSVDIRGRLWLYKQGRAYVEPRQ
jgi:tetratricopeptide (TPR) repeat protein